MNVDELFLETIGKYNMLMQGDEVTVGFSGGADSVALLSLLHYHSDILGIKLAAVHLNHSLRGEESIRDMNFVQSFCEKLGIPLFIKTLDIAGLAKNRGESIEVCARNERYRFFSDISKGGKIATAHNATDNLETVILNIARGTSLAGLCGIPPVRDNIIRPLIEFPRALIESYCQEKNLEYVTDSSNLTNDYTRNKIRHLILPTMREINPTAEQKAVEMTSLLRQDENYLFNAAQSALSSIKIDDNRYSCEKFNIYETQISSRIVIILLKQIGVAYNSDRISLCLNLIKNSGAPVQLSPQWRMFCDKKTFSLVKKTRKEQPFCIQVNKTDFYDRAEFDVIDGKTLVFTSYDCEKFANIVKTNKNYLKNALDYDMMNTIVRIRSRMPKDKIKLLGRGCTKTVKDLQRESAMCESLRQKMAIIESDGKLVWIEGFGIAQDFAPTANTRHIITIEVKNELRDEQ